jgi:hypothetical protein
LCARNSGSKFSSDGSRLACGKPPHPLLHHLSSKETSLDEALFWPIFGQSLRPKDRQDIVRVAATTAAEPGDLSGKRDLRRGFRMLVSEHAWICCTIRGMLVLRSAVVIELGSTAV